jgi:hypothetical protein
MFLPRGYITMLLGLAAGLCAGLCSGCNVIGFAAATVAGTSNTPPMYVLTKQPTVVVAENYNDPAVSVRDDEPLARYVTDLLKAGDVVPTIDSSEVYVMRHDFGAGTVSPKWRGLSIAAVGRSVTAHQVIYLNITAASIETSPGSDAMRGHGEVLVRVVDAESGATLWPHDTAEGSLVTADTRMYHRGETEEDVRTVLHHELADKIVKLFTGFRTD